MKTIVDNFGSDVDAALDAALRFDPLDTAEKLMESGGGSRADAGMLGLMLAIDHNGKKDKMLKELGDTTFSNELGRYQAIIEALGFEQVLAIPFTGNSDWLNEETGQPYEEQYFIYARRDGLLLSFDTYNSKGVNAAHLYYNWEFDSTVDGWWNVTSSGGVRKTDDGRSVYVGHHDAREALKFKISKLERRGKFLSKWVEQPFLWLLHYMDNKDERVSLRSGGDHYAVINAQRIAMLPEWVQEMIGTNEG